MFLRPDFVLNNIYEIDLEMLKTKGIKSIFFDLDSTIMVSKWATYLEETEKWLKKVDKDFFIAVISNNKKCEYLDKVRSVSSFQIIGDAKKPSTKAIRKLLSKINMTDRKSTRLNSSHQIMSYAVVC